MAPKRRALGRGLGALIPAGPSSLEAQADNDAPAATDLPEATVVTVPLVDVPAHYREIPQNSISTNPRQPRQVFEEEAMAELVHSIREIGLLQPVVVRPTSDPDRFELVAGERRWRASQLAGLTAIPAIVRETPDDHLLRDALIENLHRSSLNPLEEAAAYQQLLDDFGCTQDELAARIGRSRPQVTNTIRLLRLPPPVARRVAAGVLSAGHARALLSLGDEAAMEALATRIVAEGLSVRATEEIVSIGAAGGKRKERRPRGARTTPVEVAELVDRAAEVLETRITAEVNRTHGRMIVEFASIEDLRRIVDILERTTTHDRSATPHG